MSTKKNNAYENLNKGGRVAGAAKASIRKMEEGMIITPDVINKEDIDRLCEEIRTTYLDVEMAAVSTGISSDAIRKYLAGSYEYTEYANLMIQKAEVEQYKNLMEEAKSGNDKIALVLIKQIDERSKARKQVIYEIAYLMDQAKKTLKDEDYRRWLQACSTSTNANTMAEYDRKLTEMGLV